MRRILAIVLLVLLPLQWSWAAVATYCGHESSAATAHFGHHEHQHDADAGFDVQGDKTPGSMDLDCSHCHGSFSAMLGMPSVLAGMRSVTRPAAAPDRAASSHALTRPERPQWPTLA